MTENKLQQQCLLWFNNTYCRVGIIPRGMILHIPNGTREGRKLFNLGLYPGAADLLIIWDGKPYFFELKTKKGRQTDKQKAFETHCRDSGVYYRVVRSFNEFKSAVLADVIK
jgi:hypothetical protein